METDFAAFVAWRRFQVSPSASESRLVKVRFDDPQMGS